MNNILLDILAELKEQLDRYNIPLIIGGGMGIYIRRLFLKEERQTRYPTTTTLRSTTDIDVFFTGELIVDLDKITQIRDVLIKLHYEPVVPYFQFYKEVKLQGAPSKVKIDLLASPPSDSDKKKVKIKEMRIKPKDAENIHAYLTNEALGISIGLVPINLKNSYPDRKIKNTNLYVPSRYNYIILKLHAFQDRKDDDRVDSGRHHAYDIFTNVIDMTENDWKNAAEHFELEKEKKYINNSISICNNFFIREDGLGIIRIKENLDYQSRREIFDLYMPHFISDMKELFHIKIE